MVSALLLTLSGVQTHAAYTDQAVEGFTLRVETALVKEHPELWADTRRELSNQLYRIVRVVPEEPLAKLRQIVVWVHRQGPWTQCMAYHPSKEWLTQNGLNPEMALDIEVGNAKTFLVWTMEQPWMVLHELAHGYHDRFMKDGYENKAVKDAWQAAMASRKYESVLRYNGQKQRHYACTNQMEYFAESTEAFFGQNDFYPFVRAELEAFDPAANELMKTVWGGIKKRG